MATDIQIISLRADGGLGQIIVTVLATPPAGMACLPYMQPASIKVYEAATNNFGAAAVVGTINSGTGVFVRGGLGASTTRYYWAAALDADGNEGARYPVGNGAAATTLNAQPGPNSVGPNELQSDAVRVQHIANLAVTNAKIASLSATKLTAGTITATISIVGPTITGGMVQTAASGARAYMGGDTIVVTNASGATIGSLTAGTFGEVLFINSGSRKAFSISAQNPVGTIQGAGAGTTLTITTSGTGIALSGLNSAGGGGGLVGTPTGFGGYAFYATGGGYGPFTGSHDALILKDDLAEPGDIVFDKRILQRAGWGDTLSEVAVASEVGKRGVVGVVAVRFPFEPMSDFAAFRAPFDRRTDRQRERGFGQSPEPGIVRRRWVDRYDRLKINSVGEGQMNVCGRGGALECGDLICASDLAGKGQRQHDDIVRGWTVAKVREDVAFDHPDQVKIVAVIYLCG
jgi:hypothetical protein